MEISSKHPERENPSPANSPKSNGGETSWSSPTGNGGQQPLTPKLIPRSESNPYPTTFVQADTANFKQVVQMLTGSTEKPASKPSQDPLQSSRNFSIPPMKTAPKKQQSFKLYERRNNLKNSLMINTLLPNFAQNSGLSPRNSEVLLSPSILDFDFLSLALSPVTPLNDDPFGKSSPSMGSSSKEEKAISEKGFFLHPSPLSTPREADPQLLPLFPVTSPKLSGSSS